MTGGHAAVVGGGIVGLAVAHELLGRAWRITVLESLDNIGNDEGASQR